MNTIEMAIGCDAAAPPPHSTVVRASSGVSLRIAPREEVTEDVVFRAKFFKLVQREKRRADRSKSPLSIAIFEAEHEASEHRQYGDRLLSCLIRARRDTDVLGRLDDEVVAVLLPDTNETGLQRFLDRVALASNGSAPSASTATYPDQLFDQVINKRSSSAEFKPTPDRRLTPSREHGYSLKRTLDILGAILAIVLLAPLMLVTAAAIRLSSPGPVIFRQVRMGKGGVPFVMYKFRSMVSDADDRIHRDFVAGLIAGSPRSANHPDGPGPEFKMKSDPRITRIGKFLRQTSIDEMPQFFNVLKGDMSLVGPRPPVTYEVEKYEAWHLRRVLEMRPGMTGIWQVEGRSKVSFDDMVRMDLLYLRACSLRFDIVVLMRTIPAVLRCDGAL